MPSADKQKKQKVPSRKARKHMTEAARRGATHSNIAFERYMKPDGGSKLFLARVEKVSGNGRFEVLSLEDGTEHKPKISGDLKLSGRAARNPMVRTAITSGDYVLTDGGRIEAVLTSEQAGQARHKIGRSRSHNSLFSHRSYHSAGVEAKQEARKEAHKRGPATRKSNSRSRSASKSSRSRSSHASSGTRRSGSKGSKGSRNMPKGRRAPNMASRRSRAKYGFAALAASATANAAAAAAHNRELEKDAEAEAYFAARAVPKAWNK
jgi:hypothetical protein